MKPFIFTLAMLILFSIFLTYQVDNNNYIRQLEKLKNVADECSSSAGLFYDEELYSKGTTIYNQQEGNKVIKYVIRKSLKLEEDLTSSPSSYWKNQIQYKVTYLDNSNTSFPYMYSDEKNGFTKLITKPTIVVEINASKPPFRLKFINTRDAIRVSAYEYLDR
ncbi:MAG: hypothetical protein N4A50_01950 [Vallitalea sp.]|jgi:hypothetical protein|nr:hypothetical protein [Vallitalea sp.]